VQQRGKKKGRDITQEAVPLRKDASIWNKTAHPHRKKTNPGGVFFGKDRVQGVKG